MVYWDWIKKKIALPEQKCCRFVPFQNFIFFRTMYRLMTHVTVYSTKTCQYCRMAKALLEQYGVPFETIDVGEDEDAARKMIELSGQRGVPVITVDDEVIVGFDAQRLNELFGTAVASDIYAALIIGAGPAGLTAGVYCARKMLNTLIVSENIGGQALESWAIENYMGYRVVTGEDLMKKFEEQVRILNIRLELDRVVSIRKVENIFEVKTAADKTFRARSIILTQGKKPKKLGVANEEQYLGRGLSICSTCDGPLYKGKRVAVVGGGNSALQTALEMSKIATSVSLIVRSSIRADPIYTERLASVTNITVHTGTRISALQGEKFLSGITIKDGKGNEQQIGLDAVFIEIGWTPNTEMLEGLVDLNDQKEVIVDVNGCTSRPGIFAAGDITNAKSKQIIIAAGEGAKAALEAYEYLMKK